MSFAALANEIYLNLDLIWIPVALITVNEGQRVKAAIFCAACYLFLRLQLELMVSFGYPNGIFGLMDTALYVRGLACYSVTTMIFLGLSIWSPNTKGIMFMAATLSIFFMAVTISSILLIL